MIDQQAFLALLHLVQRLPATLPAADNSDSGVRANLTFDYGGHCSLLLNSGGWSNVPYVRCEASTRSVATCGANHTNSWQWAPQARQCGAARISSAQAQFLLQHKWIVMAGDSITRFMFAALLRLLAQDDEQKIVFGHQDFQYTLPGNVRASFIWAPYTVNVTSHIQKWASGDQYPDMIVVSTGLWHMLHIGSPEGFQSAVTQLKQQSESLVNKPGADVRMHFLSITEVYPAKLRSEEKRQALTLQRVDEYNQCIQDSHTLLPAGPFSLIDMHHLTQGCGLDCTHDGLHYSNTTYDAALQIWINSLQL
ncbi:hypothetical protein ABBQ38_013293 [Trebouxia sp. C0009 RCD-2024]